jgi:predicted alpha/beta-fold hydrolase
MGMNPFHQQAGVQLNISFGSMQQHSEIVVTKQSPPMCLIHAHDDPWTAAGSSLLYLEYKKQGLPCELHIFAKGGHGFGMKPNGQPVNAWPQRVVEWMHSMGYTP